MKPHLFFSAALLLLPGISPAQNIPPYTVNVCDTASSGYYFFVPIKIGPGFNPTHLILDEEGRVIYTKEFTAATGDFRIQPNGMMSYSYAASHYYIMDSTFTVIDSVACRNGLIQDNHDLQILPNGHYLLMGYENVTMDLSMYNYFGPNHNLPGNSSATVRCGVIQEQDQNHNVVFEWHCKDHYAFADVDEEWMSSPLNVDWTHFNAVELDTDGNLLISVRHFNEITKVSRADSSIIWRLGGNANQFTFTNDPAMFIGQHDIRRQANGNVTIFDNGRSGPPFHAAAGKEYTLDENLMTATLAWSYTENPNVRSLFIGNMHRNTAGNSLVNYGQTPQQTLMFNVVDPSGAKIFEIEFGDTLRTYRAFNYLTLPWALPRPQIACSFDGTQYILDAGTHASYLWSTGATTQTIAVSAADTFSVFVPVGQGGFIRSEFFIVGDPQNPCWGALDVEEQQAATLEIFPNPVNDVLTLQLASPAEQFASLEIVDVSGHCVKTVPLSAGTTRLEVSLAGIAPGVYFVKAGNVARRIVKQ